MGLARRLLPLGLILFYVSWDMWAVLTDNRVAPFDTVLESLPGEDLLEWLGQERKGPLVPLMVSALDALVGDLLLAARVLSVVAHGLPLGLVWVVTRRHTASLTAAATAVMLCGVMPGVHGWARMEYHASVLALAVMLTLYLLMTCRPLTTRRAVVLGLVVGAGVLAKPGYVAYVLVPGALFLASALRDGPSRRGVVIGLGVALVTVGWWVALAWGTLTQYVMRSSEIARQGEPMLVVERVDLCLTIIPAPVLLLSLAAAAFAWFRRPASHALLLLFGSCLMVTLLLMLVVFDTIARYFVPLGPVAAVLLAVGLHEVGRAVVPRLSAVTARVLPLIGALALVAVFCALNLAGTEHQAQEREGFEGMARPDRRPYRKVPDAARLLRERGWTLAAVLDTDRHCAEHDLIWRSRGVALPVVQGDEVPALLREGRPVHVAVCHGLEPMLSLLRADGVLAELDPGLVKKILAGGLKVVRTFDNPDQSYLSILRLP